MSSPLFRERAGTPPFVKPYLYALDRLQERETLRPEQLTERARRLLQEQLGGAEAPVEGAFAHGGTGLLGEHTHYFDGFALLLALPQGTAVAVRTAAGPASRIVFDGSDHTWTFDRTAPAENDSGETPSWACLVEYLVRRLAPAAVQVEAAIVSTIHASCMDAYLAALGVATTRALQALFALPDDTEPLLRQVCEILIACLDCPFSIAYLIAADAGRPDAYVLVDTHTFEHLALPAPAHDVLGWGLVDVGRAPLREAAFYRKRKEMAEEALGVLQKKGFPQVRSLRELEHRDLQAALGVLPRRLRPIVRHLVTENRRVQKLVAAVRRRDWQMFGALLLMSHASLRNDWESTTEEVDFVVEQVEAMSVEGMYGACMTGRGGCVLMLGQPFIVPRCLDRIQTAGEARFGTAPDVMLL